VRLCRPNMDPSNSTQPPSRLRPPSTSGAITRSQSFNASASNSRAGGETNNSTDNTNPTDTSITFRSRAEFEAYLEAWSVSKGFVSTSNKHPNPRASDLSGSEAPIRKEADRILWRKLPSYGQYDDWRHAMIANIIAASVDQSAATQFTDAVSSGTDISFVPSAMSSIDAKLKAALLSAIQEAPEENRGRIMASFGGDPSINGRQLFRIIDQDYGIRTNDSLAQKNVALLSLECCSYREFGAFLTKWKKYDGMLQGTDQEIPENTKMAFLRHALKSVTEVSAILAQNKANLGSYASLIDALTDFEATNRTWMDTNKGKKVALATASTNFASASSFRPCSYCTKRFGGKKKIKHSDDQCFTNPASKNYRPPRNQGSRTSSAPGLASGRSGNPHLDAESIASIAAIIADQLKGSEGATNKAGIAKLHPRATIDSGASYSITGLHDTLGEIIQEQPLPSPISLDCVGGVVEALDKFVVSNPTLGELEALRVNNSPPVLSLGQLVKSGYSFRWSYDKYGTPLLIKPDGTKVALEVENHTPVLAKVSLATAKDFSAYGHNTLHFPMDSSCPTCIVAKSKKTSARRIRDPNYKRASTFLERVSIDIIEVSEKDIMGNRYLFTLRDDYSGFIQVRPQKTKTASECLDSFRDIARNFPRVPEILRSDNGSEFDGEFEEEMKRLYIRREYSLPYRSSSNGRHERANQEINRAIRAILFHAGLPTSFWGYASLYVSDTINHLKVPKSVFPGNPCEVSTGMICQCHHRAVELYGAWPHFGCHVSFIPESHDHKMGSRSLPGILIGILNQTDLLVLRTEDFIRDQRVSTFVTRDAKINLDLFPARELGMRPEHDLVFYNLIKHSADLSNIQKCLQCGQVRPSFSLSCPKCLDDTSSVKHARNYTCKFGRCRCKTMDNFVGFNPSNEFWNLDDDDSSFGNEAEAAEASMSSFEEIQSNLGEHLFDLPPPLDDLNDEGRTHDWDFTENSASSMKGLLTRVVNPREYDSTPEGQSAIQEELENMTSHGVWDYKEVVPRERAETIPDALFVPVKLIMGIKNPELEPSKQKIKARLVAQGCSSRNSQRERAIDFDFPYDAPASLLSFRLAMWAASFEGMQATFADVKSAYLHAPLRGPPTFLILPENLHPKEWKGVENPVVMAHKAIYGLNRSGSDFSEYLRHILESNGWVQCSWDISLYFKPGCLLVCYVDDLCLVSRKESTQQELAFLRKHLEIPNVTILDEKNDSARYLGMTVLRSDTFIHVSSYDYARSVLSDFCEVIGKPVLKRSKTPSLSFEHTNEGELLTAGILASYASSFVGKLLWLCRTTRPDLAYAASFLGRMVTNWTVFSDRCLSRLMEYLFHNTDVKLSFEMKPMLESIVNINVYCDADHAGSGPKSTNGLACLLGSELVHWSSKLQSSTATSSTEAELIAASYALKEGIAPLETFFEESGIMKSKTTLFMDSEPAMKAIRKGFSPRMKHLKRIHKINLDLLHDEVHKNNDRSISHVSTHENLADIFTKDLQAPSFAKLLSQLVVDRGKLGLSAGGGM
jgi:ribonuclease HI